MDKWISNGTHLVPFLGYSKCAEDIPMIFRCTMKLEILLCRIAHEGLTLEFGCRNQQKKSRQWSEHTSVAATARTTKPRTRPRWIQKYKLVSSPKVAPLWTDYDLAMTLSRMIRPWVSWCDPESYSCGITGMEHLLDLIATKPRTWWCLWSSSFIRLLAKESHISRRDAMAIVRALCHIMPLLLIWCLRLETWMYESRRTYIWHNDHIMCRGAT